MIKTIQVPLGARPELVKAGICEHGYRRRERHVTSEWVMHLYNFACSVEWDGTLYKIIPGTICLFPPAATITFTFPQKSCLIHYVHFHAKDTELISARHINFLRRCGSEMNLFCAQMEHIAVFFLPDPLRAEVALWSLLFKLTGNPDAPDRRVIDFNKAPIDIAVTIIQSELSQNLKVADICSRSGASPSCLNRQCNEKYGMSLKEYLQRERAGKALERLQKTRLPIRAIAEDLGFLNVQQFNRFMHKRFSLSPKEIRDSV